MTSNKSLIIIFMPFQNSSLEILVYINIDEYYYYININWSREKFRIKILENNWRLE